ncbi:MAG: hypothetical protein K8R25_17500 [Methanosarcinales archaeon]|nr:hypothetical protein [Methanosarcinales archaeon]
MKKQINKDPITPFKMKSKGRAFPVKVKKPCKNKDAIIIHPTISHLIERRLED